VKETELVQRGSDPNPKLPELDFGRWEKAVKIGAEVDLQEET
jgi:hypothetical protein